jgi:L-threonylcarbamoyladenylate synthase
MGTEVLRVDPARPAPTSLARASEILKSGRLVAFPTETFYGLAVAALDARAVRALFALKGRPESKPVLVLVDSVAMAETLAEVGAMARDLMTRYWPGALTLVLPARDVVPTEITAGTGTVGVRLSSHPVACGLVRALGAPITAPSANPTGAAPPTSAAAVLDYFPDTLDLVLDGGATAGGPASTVLDVRFEPPRVIREGAVRVPCG